MLDQSKKIVDLSVELLNVGSKIIHKQGLGVVFNLSDEAMALSTFDAVAFKAEWPKGSLKANAVELVAAAKAKLDLENKAVQAKLSSGLDLAVDGLGLVDSALDYASKVKALFS